MTGSHEMFIGKVEYVHAAANLVNEDGSIDFSQIKFL
jgi:flavin reductase (DIM6/NTAB) family NADH-FMN oxidoreductase RutF